MTFDEIRAWLVETTPEKLEKLWLSADSLRHDTVGDEVYLRGLVEISNICRRNCLYCGIRAGNPKPQRYRMSAAEMVETALLAKKLGYGTVVLQSGEDGSVPAEEIAGIIGQIKRETNLAVTLSLGEREEEDYVTWFKAGANRYLLRFETSNETLYQTIHPPVSRGRDSGSRIELLKTLRKIGYEIGSGVMAGIPGQTWDDLARDIALFAELDLDMIGCGPFLPHPDTPLGQDRGAGDVSPRREVPNDQVILDEHLPFKVIALARLVCPAANIPTTTAIATLDPVHGRLLGLSRGANVVMPNLTPARYRKMYEIYPHKAASGETPEETHELAVRQILELGRTVGQGAGNRLAFTAKHGSKPAP